jgi:signal transduction histidine kinase
LQKKSYEFIFSLFLPIYISGNPIDGYIMINTLKSLDYPYELSEALFKARIGTVGSSILGPLLAVYLFQDTIPLWINIIFVISQIFIFIFRLFIANHALTTIQQSDKNKIQSYLKAYLIAIFLNAFLLGIYSLFVIHYGNTTSIFLYISILYALNAGAMSTLSSVFHALFIFTITSLGLLIIALLFVGNSTMYYFIAVLTALFIFITIPASFRIYTILNRGILQTNEIKALNISLEEKIQQRTKELAQKTQQLEILNRSLDQRVKEESEKSRKNERLLIQQSRQAAMGEMIGNIAHQWRQPLNALGLILQNIYFTYQMDELNDEFMEKSIDKGKKLTTSMSKTIDDFRDFFKPNKLKEDFNISQTIKNTIELIEASYHNNNIILQTHLNEKIITEGYPNEFSQVILNILSNAKDALLEKKKEHKVVTISTFATENHAIITIEDNAGGIPEHIINRIFDPYFTTKEEGQGTGIGLYMSKTIIENNMRGKISVQNHKEGACFTIKLKKKSLQAEQSQHPEDIDHKDDRRAENKERHHSGFTVV